MVNRIYSFDGHIPILDDPYDQSETQKCPLGTRLAMADGRVFRYAKNGAVALAAGNVVQSAVPIVQFSNATDGLRATAGLTAGSKVLTANSTAGAASAAADLFADGFLGVAVGSGSGHVYQVKSHTAAASNASFTINLHDPLKVAINSQSSLGLIQNLYKNVVVSPASMQTGITLGITPTAITANYYFWLQTWGICAALGGGNVTTAGYAVMPSTSTAGALNSTGLATATGVCKEIGQQLTTSTAAGTQFVYITLAP